MRRGKTRVKEGRGGWVAGWESSWGGMGEWERAMVM